MTISYQYQQQVAQDRFALRLTARLSDAADKLPYDVSERLRASRERALGKRRMAPVRVGAGAVLFSGAELALGSGYRSWWDRLASVLPLLALVVGLISIHIIQNDNRANELAEIDTALLTDDLPPAAYADPGFAQFLKTSSIQVQ